MGWLSKIDLLAGTIDELKKSTKSKKDDSEICIHGEEGGCVRCASSDIDTESQSVWVDLEEDDIKRVVFSLPDEVREVLRKHPEEAVLAGGYIRANIAGEEPRDIDIFMPAKKSAKDWMVDEGITSNEGELCWEVAAKKDRLPMQAVWRYPFKAPYEILEQFDYIITKAAIYFHNGSKDVKPSYVGICHRLFYKDLARKALTYESDRGDEYLMSIPRLMKFIVRGYVIDPHSLATVITKTCLSLDLSNGFEGIEKQLEAVYKPGGTNQDWEKLTKKYVKPKPAPEPRHYSSGS